MKRWISESKASGRSSAPRARASARAARRRSSREGVNVVITARGADALEATARELRALGARRGARRRRRHHDRGRPRRRARRLPAGRHPRQQRRRPAAGRLPRLGPRRLDQGARRQHADADRADQGDRRRDGRARLRPRRQHHLGRGEGADRRARPVERRAQRPDRLRRRPRAHRLAARGVTINGLLPGAFDTDRLRATTAAARPSATARRSRQVIDARQARRSRRSASARPTSSAPLCAFLCSVHAGYITGQNMLIDGGAYPGTF